MITLDKREELYMKAIDLRTEVNKLIGESGELVYETSLLDGEVKKSFEMIKKKGFFLLIIDGDDVTISNISCLNNIQHLHIVETLNKLMKAILRKI